MTDEQQQRDNDEISLKEFFCCCLNRWNTFHQTNVLKILKFDYKSISKQIGATGKLLYTDIINNNYIITFDDLCELLEPRLENSGYYLNSSGHPYPKNSHIKTINNLKQIIYNARLNKNRFEWIKAVIRAKKKKFKT